MHGANGAGEAAARRISAGSRWRGEEDESDMWGPHVSERRERRRNRRKARFKEESVLPRIRHRRERAERPVGRESQAARAGRQAKAGESRPAGP